MSLLSKWLKAFLNSSQSLTSGKKKVFHTSWCVVSSPPLNHVKVTLGRRFKEVGHSDASHQAPACQHHFNLPLFSPLPTPNQHRPQAEAGKVTLASSSHGNKRPCWDHSGIPARSQTSPGHILPNVLLSQLAAWIGHLSADCLPNSTSKRKCPFLLV